MLITHTLLGNVALRWMRRWWRLPSDDGRAPRTQLADGCTFWMISEWAGIIRVYAGRFHSWPYFDLEGKTWCWLAQKNLGVCLLACSSLPVSECTMTGLLAWWLMSLLLWWWVLVPADDTGTEMGKDASMCSCTFAIRVWTNQTWICCMTLLSEVVRTSHSLPCWIPVVSNTWLPIQQLYKHLPWYLYKMNWLTWLTEMPFFKTKQELREQSSYKTQRSIIWNG